MGSSSISSPAVEDNKMEETDNSIAAKYRNRYDLSFGRVSKQVFFLF